MTEKEYAIIKELIKQMQQRLAEQELGAVIFTPAQEMLNQALAHFKGLSSGGISSSPFLKENKQEFGHRILQKF